MATALAATFIIGSAGLRDTRELFIWLSEKRQKRLGGRAEAFSGFEGAFRGAAQNASRQSFVLLARPVMLSSAV